MFYTLFKNKLTKDIEDNYCAKHVNGITLNRSHLLDDITGEGSILKITESKAAIEAYWSRIIKYISEGKEYRDECICVGITITGNFIGKKARFDPNVHDVTVRFNPNKLVKMATRDIQPQYIDPDYDRAVVESVYDWSSDSENTTISPNGVVEVFGRDLKIYKEVEGAGIFFVNKDSGEEVKISRIRINEPRSLSFMVPELAAGNYRLEIRNSARDGAQLRVGSSSIEYTVS